MDGNKISWLIWSNKHDAWWNPDRNGYTPHVDRAGRYSLDEAAEICNKANLFRRETEEPNETMLPEPM